MRSTRPRHPLPWFWFGYRFTSADAPADVHRQPHSRRNSCPRHSTAGQLPDVLSDSRRHRRRRFDCVNGMLHSIPSASRHRSTSPAAGSCRICWPLSSSLCSAAGSIPSRPASTSSRSLRRSKSRHCSSVSPSTYGMLTAGPPDLRATPAHHRGTQRQLDTSRPAHAPATIECSDAPTDGVHPVCSDPFPAAHPQLSVRCRTTGGNCRRLRMDFPSDQGAQRRPRHPAAATLEFAFVES